MGDHIVLSVDPLIAPASLQPLHGAEAQGSLDEGSSSKIADLPTSAIHVNDVGECDALEEEEEEEHCLIQIEECRICQEEDSLNNLDTPCACSGTLKFAHRRCVQLWCYEKGDTICEICHQPFGPGYTAISPLYHPEDTSIDISEDWATSSTPLDLHDPRLLAIAAVEHQALEAEHDDYVYAGISGTTFGRSTALILMALLLLRHAAPLFNTDVEKALTYISQAAAELAFMLQAEQLQG